MFYHISFIVQLPQCWKKMFKIICAQLLCSCGSSYGNVMITNLNGKVSSNKVKVIRWVENLGNVLWLIKLFFITCVLSWLVMGVISVLMTESCYRALTFWSFKNIDQLHFNSFINGKLLNDENISIKNQFYFKSCFLFLFPFFLTSFYFMFIGTAWI